MEILRDTQGEVIGTTKNVIQAGEKMRLIIRKGKNQNICKSQDKKSRGSNINNIINIKINQYIFECVDNFKYFGRLINSRNNMHQETQQ